MSTHLPHNHNHKNIDAILINNMPSNDAVASVAEIIKQLSDPLRLKIFWLLCHTEECVLDIASMVQMSSPAVSHHLKLLKSSGLIVSRKEGKEVLYQAASSPLADALHMTIETILPITCPNAIQ